MELRTLAFVLAGGKGTRLYPLTKERAKPAVPFGGRYRIVDFVLSNLINSGIYSTYVLIQFKSQSLLQHLREGWEIGGLLRNHFIIPVPAQMRSAGEDWYRGTADAIYQNANLIEQASPDIVAIFGADHIYRMNIREMIEFHHAKQAKVTVAAIPVAKEFAREFGVIEIDANNRIIGFHEKNTDAPTMPGRPDMVFASMGNYIFSTDVLLRELYDDGEKENSSHDFGRDILPGLIGRIEMFAYDFQSNRIPGDPTGQVAYWRDVGTIDAYYEANMDLKNVVPSLNLYNWDWPIITANYPDPPAKLVFDDDSRRGVAIQSVLCGGCIVAGGFVKDSVLGRNVFVDAGAEVKESILFDNVYVGRGARIHRGIIDKNVRIAPGDHIGHDLARDALRHTVSEGGVTVVQKARDTLLTRSRNF
jgi:glucose-1-phosphate adenylyltransferase